MKKKATKKASKKTTKRKSKGKQHPLRAQTLINLANGIEAYGPGTPLSTTMLASVLRNEATQIRTILR
jgi:hypothetical protein